MVSKPILFVDFDGTLCFDRYWRSLPPHLYDQIQQFIFGEDKTLLNDWMKGKYTAEEINQMAAEKLGMPYEELWNLFVQDCNTMYIAPELLEKLASLRDRYTVILVTGSMDSFSRFTVPALKLNTYFDHINNSFFAGKLKVDEGGAIFKDYAQALNIPLENCFLLDNSPNTCKLFKSLGGTAYLVNPEHNAMHYLNQLK